MNTFPSDRSSAAMFGRAPYKDTNDGNGKTSLAQFAKLLNKYYSQGSVIDHIVQNGKSLTPEKAAVLDREMATRVRQAVFSLSLTCI